MYDFNYQRANSVADASAKVKASDDGILMAGGMTLIPHTQAAVGPTGRRRRPRGDQ